MKILIISQHIFPIQTPRANRATELAKEFAKKGHEVIVYAVLGVYDYSTFSKKYNIRIENIPVSFQVKPYTSDGVKPKHIVDQVFSKSLGKILEFPYIEFYFKIPAIIKKEDKADLLISIADPHQIHWGCSNAKIKYPNKFPEKWIADCGDPFMADNKTKNHFRYFSKFEKQFCNLCDYITVPVKEAVEGYYKEYRNKIKIIPQGFAFDLPIVEKLSPHHTVPTFAYAGTFYKDIRNPKMFLEYLSTHKTDFKFIVYTNYKDLVNPYKQILKNKLEIRDPIEREKLIKILSKMDFLLNLRNKNSPNQIPSKLIDYAIAGRPILTIDTTNIDTTKIDEFLSGNYTNKKIIPNIDQYNITNVAKQFIDLAQ